MTGARRPWRAAGVLLLFVAGCGAQYRPVVTPITTTGPAPQPTNVYMVALSSPSATSPGLATLIDAFGDSVLEQATLSNNPFAFVLNSSGGFGYNLQGNGTTANADTGFTLSSYIVSAGTTSTTGLRTQGVNTATIFPQAYPTNGISTSTAFYLVEPYTDPVSGVSYRGNAGYVGEFTGATPALQQEIQVAPNPVNFAGTSAGPRVYVISQGNTAQGPLSSPNACNTPSGVTTNGEADALEVTTNTISKRIPVGICPVYGIESADFLRAYILNRGSGTVSVINAQANTPDATTPTITVGAGPVHADLYPPSSLLVTANYDSDTVSVINVPTDIYDNDGPGFGTVTTISLRTTQSPTPKGPVAVTILRDGSRAYIANQLDGSVSIVDLTTFQVTKTIALPPNSNGVQVQPRSIASVYSTPAGTVYVASPNSNTLAVINTETDTVSATVLLPANAVSVYSTAQSVSTPATSNAIVNSNASGRGVPCASGDASPFCPQPAQ